MFYLLSDDLDLDNPKADEFDRLTEVSSLVDFWCSRFSFCSINIARCFLTNGVFKIALALKIIWFGF